MRANFYRNLICLVGLLLMVFAVQPTSASGPNTDLPYCANFIPEFPEQVAEIFNSTETIKYRIAVDWDDNGYIVIKYDEAVPSRGELTLEKNEVSYDIYVGQENPISTVGVGAKIGTFISLATMKEVRLIRFCAKSVDVLSISRLNPEEVEQARELELKHLKALESDHKLINFIGVVAIVFFGLVGAYMLYSRIKRARANKNMPHPKDGNI
jgi:hypothetical protein